MALLPGTRLDPCEMISPLGAGGMAAKTTSTFGSVVMTLDGQPTPLVTNGPPDANEYALYILILDTKPRPVHPERGATR